jgi:hypothetical protein
LLRRKAQITKLSQSEPHRDNSIPLHDRRASRRAFRFSRAADVIGFSVWPLGQTY